MFADIWQFGDDLYPIITANFFIVMGGLTSFALILLRFMVPPSWKKNYLQRLGWLVLLLAVVTVTAWTLKIVTPQSAKANTETAQHDREKKSPAEDHPLNVPQNQSKEDQRATAKLKQDQEELRSWFVQPLPQRPDGPCVVVVLAVEGTDVSAEKLRNAVEEEVARSGRRVWRVGVLNGFVREKFRALWLGAVEPQLWHERLRSAPPDEFVLIRLHCLGPKKAEYDLVSVRGSVQVRCVTADGRVLAVQEADAVHAQVDAVLATQGMIHDLTGRLQQQQLVRKALP